MHPCDYGAILRTAGGFVNAGCVGTGTNCTSLCLLYVSCFLFNVIFVGTAVQLVNMIFVKMKATDAENNYSHRRQKNNSVMSKVILHTLPMKLAFSERKIQFIW